MKMDATAGFWVAVAVGMVPLAGLFWWWNDYWYALPLRLHGGGAKLPPGYMGIPFLGEMPAFLWYFKVLRRPDDFINAKRRRYGDGVGLYRTYLLRSPTIIACTPSANKLVLQDDSSFGMPWNCTQLILIGATGVGAVEGAAHSKVKAFIVRAVNQPDALRKFTPLLQTRIAASLQSWSHKGRITVCKEARKAILGNIGKCLASIETEHDLETIDDLVKGMLDGLRAYPINFPGTAFYHSLQCSGKLKAIFRQELEKRKRCDGSEAKNDVMEALMEMKEQEGKGLSEDEIVDNMMALFEAGYETTSISIMWTFYYLAKHSDVLLKLREEHMLVRKKVGDMLTYQEITSCKYTTKVVEEILRMASSAAFMVRTAKKDVDYRGYRIPKGWKVACWFRYLHTNPENFEDPMCFNPERWNEAPKAGSNLVFGGGVRVCGGNMFARLQISLLLHHLVLGYRWRLVNPNAEVLYIPYPRPADEVEIDITRI